MNTLAVRLICLLAVCLAAAYPLPGAYGGGWPTHRLIGKSLPDFSHISYAGEQVSNASLKGGVYILTFWFPG